MVASQTPLAVACSFWKSRSILFTEHFYEPKLNIQFEFVMIICLIRASSKAISSFSSSSRASIRTRFDFFCQPGNQHTFPDALSSSPARGLSHLTSAFPSGSCGIASCAIAHWLCHLPHLLPLDIIEHA